MASTESVLEVSGRSVSLFKPHRQPPWAGPEDGRREGLQIEFRDVHKAFGSNHVLNGLGFARALAMDPSVLLFDEPGSGLDVVRCALLCQLIQEIHETSGGTYVVVTHDMFSARRIADHICVLWKGELVQSGPAHEIIESDDAFVKQFLHGQSRGPLGMD